MFLQMELTTVEQTLNTKPSLGVVVPCPNLWSLPVRGLRVNELEEQLKASRWRLPSSSML